MAASAELVKGTRVALTALMALGWCLGYPARMSVKTSFLAGSASAHQKHVQLCISRIMRLH